MARSVVAIVVIALLVAFGISATDKMPLALAGPRALRGEPSGLAKRDIPRNYRSWYAAAVRARCPKLPWSVLAGIGKVETDHGRLNAPGVRTGANYAGARGPMQFLPTTFARYGLDADHDGRADIYDPVDAINSAARLLCASGARNGTLTGIKDALFAYNHAHWYVDKTLNWATRYTSED